MNIRKKRVAILIVILVFSFVYIDKQLDYHNDVDSYIMSDTIGKMAILEESLQDIQSSIEHSETDEEIVSTIRKSTIRIMDIHKGFSKTKLLNKNYDIELMNLIRCLTSLTKKERKNYSITDEEKDKLQNFLVNREDYQTFYFPYAFESINNKWTRMKMPQKLEDYINYLNEKTDIRK